VFVVVVVIVVVVVVIVVAVVMVVVVVVVVVVIGDNLKGRLVIVNVVSSSCLAVVCIAWPFVDINYALILLTSLGHLHTIGLDIR